MTTFPQPVLGNLTDAPQISYSPNGHAYARFTIAVGQRKLNPATNQWEDGLTDFINCVAFKETAEGVAQLTKGTTVLAVGEWKPTEWIDKDTGKKRRDRELIIRDIGPSVRRQNVQAARPPRAEGSQPWQGGQQQPQQQGGQPWQGGQTQPQQGGSPWEGQNSGFNQPTPDFNSEEAPF